MANRRHGLPVLLVLCAVMWSTGGLLVKWMAWPAFALAGRAQCHRHHRPAALPAGVALRLVGWRLSGALAGAVSMLGFVIATTLTTAANARTPFWCILLRSMSRC